MTERETTTDLAVLERLTEPAERDVLDVGCGPGHLVRSLAALGARPVGLEVSAEQLAPALAADDGSGGRYMIGRAEALPLEDATMDVVVFMRALHHVPVEEQFTALSEGRRVLRRGGYLYVAEPLTEGSYFELMRIVEDERAARLGAQLAIAEAGRAGLTAVARAEYEVQLRIADAEALRRRIVSVDPERAGVFDARRDEIAVALERLGEPAVDGGWSFRQPMRAELLRHEENAPGVA
ncbi:MAG: methyltransferase domain-containing protein [Solirubrobacteraceae bacterium]